MHPTFLVLSITSERNSTATQIRQQSVCRLVSELPNQLVKNGYQSEQHPKRTGGDRPWPCRPVQPLIEGSARPFAMFKDYWKYDWVLPVYRYPGLEALLTVLAEKVVAPAEAKLKTLEERRRAIEAELIKGTSSPFP